MRQGGDVSTRNPAFWAVLGQRPRGTSAASRSPSAAGAPDSEPALESRGVSSNDALPTAASESPIRAVVTVNPVMFAAARTFVRSAGSGSGTSPTLRPDVGKRRQSFVGRGRRATMVVSNPLLAAAGECVCGCNCDVGTSHTGFCLFHDVGYPFFRRRAACSRQRESQQQLPTFCCCCCCCCRSRFCSQVLSCFPDAQCDCYITGASAVLCCVVCLPLLLCSPRRWEPSA
jgi:hypothetical protein